MLATVCVVVVTYNRKDLLRECLTAVMQQESAVNCILVVDNASTDGTGEMVDAEFPDVEVLHLPENTGGAGGFCAGIKWGYQKGYDWLWIMDDDTIPTPGALHELLHAHETCDEDKRPVVLCSKVLWSDGCLHPTNAPRVDTRSQERIFEAADNGLLPIRYCSFVSVLIARKAVAQHGLPIADYFIWNDDVEYTARILKSSRGHWVARSLVLHKTEKKRVSMDDIRASRYFFSLRNRLWMLTRSSAWLWSERVELARSVVALIWMLLRKRNFRAAHIWIVIRGLWRGIFFGPNTVSLEDDIAV